MTQNHYFFVALTRFLFQPDFCSEIPRGSHLTLNHVNHMILNHLKWWAGSNKDPSFRFYFDLILKLSPSSVNVKSSQSESILDFTSEGLQAISSVSSIFNLQVHFISFKKLFYTFENYNFSNFCRFRNFTPFWLFLKIKYEILLKKWEIQFCYRWSRQRSPSRLIWQSIQQLKLLLLYSIRELEVSVLGVSFLHISSI